MKKFIISFFIIFFNFSVLKAEFVNQIVINGNNRVSDETIILLGDIEKDIKKQSAKYLPYIGISQIQFSTSEASSDLDPNFMGITVFFMILPLQVSTFLQISTDEV